MEIPLHAVEAAIQYAVYFIGIYILVFFLLLYLQYRPALRSSNRVRRYPSITVLVPAHNEAKNIRRCLKSLILARYPAGRLKIVVVDDGSTDATFAEARRLQIEYPGMIKVFRKAQGGKASALNEGLRHARGELVATMDADSFIRKDTIERIVELFSDSTVMAATAAVKVRRGSGWLYELQRIEYLLILFARRLLSFVDAVPVTPGPFSVFRRRLFNEIGGFDEKNIVEDHEMALRIQSHHYQIRSSLDAVVYTKTPATLRELILQRVRWHRGGLHNTLQYRWMISPRFGDFGVFVLPLVLVSVVALTIVLGFALWHIVQPPLYMAVLGADAFWLSLGPLSVLALMLIVLSLAWAYLGVRAFREEKIGAQWLLLYLVFYWYLMVAYNIVTFAKELQRQEFSWETK